MTVFFDWEKAVELNGANTLSMKKERIHVVDALRGVALLMIVSLHYVEHFDLFKEPETHFLFTASFDKNVMDWMFKLFSGKAYAIFALLFGLSFFIQLDGKKDQAGARVKFLWRMIILMLIGFIHSLFYQGDILLLYALLSIPLLFLHRLSTNTLWLIAVLLLIQIPFIYQFIELGRNPDFEVFRPLQAYWGEGGKAFSDGSFVDVVQHNLWRGRSSAWSWSYDNGRYLQILALFIIGLILGRKKVFLKINTKVTSYYWVLAVSILCFAGLYFINSSLLIKLDLEEKQLAILKTIINSIFNLTLSSSVICAVVILFARTQGKGLFKYLRAYGKMSLSNYVFQALLGTFLFYGYGLALYRYLGSAWSLILGLLVFAIQALISVWWESKYHYGPLEWIWRCASERSLKVKMKRSEIKEVYQEEVTELL